VPPFGVLIVSEQKSIGREMSETAYVIKQLAEAGVEIFEYVHGASLTPKNYMDKMMSTFRAGADEAHREQSSERVHEAHTRLHRAGHVVGGRVFGYRNQDVFHGVDRDGRPLRSHVERVINPAEAAVVRKIFMLYDQGHGLKLIAKLLTSEGALSPKHFRRTDGLAPVVGWAASTVRGVLTRETYRGQVVWNKTRKRNTWGKWAPSDRPESEWLRTTNESLRIIDEALWQRVASRRQEVEGKAVRFASGRISGRPPKHATINLLAGLATCGVCGGGLVVDTGGQRHARVPAYICHRHRANGSCTNALRMPAADLNEAVLQAIEEHALTPEPSSR
jgi:site-specific DNA recombinase